jgi:mRNA interferase MazF
MATANYVPDRGDVVWLDFHLQAGHEQAGRRPGLVLSPSAYNGCALLAVVCPISTKAKGYPFEVRIPRGFPVKGVVLSDHVRSVDWIQRNAELWCHLPLGLSDQVSLRLSKLIR